MAYDDVLWIDPAGTSLLLTGWVNYAVLADSTFGFGSPPVEVTEQVVPFQPGAQLRATRVGVRECGFDLYVKDTDAVSFRTRERNLAYLLDPTRGDGRLRIVAVDGRQVDLYCRLSQGLGGEAAGARSGPVGNWKEYGLHFRARDPYFYATTLSTIQFSAPVAGTFFPIFVPGNASILQLGNTNSFGATSTQNPGEIYAWPIWDITGPGQNIQLQNVSTVEGITYTDTMSFPSLVLSTGDHLHIDTRPLRKTASRLVGGTGTNLYQFLSQTPGLNTLWPLAPGANSVTVTMTGTTGASAASATFTARYRTI